MQNVGQMKKDRTMLEAVTRYINRLGFPSGNEPAFSDSEIADAVASLFKQVVLADGVVRQEEVAAAMRSLLTNYGHLALEASEPSIVERFSDAKTETVYSITTILNRSLNKKELAELKVHLIAVAMADREFHLYEREFMDLLDKLIKS